MTSKVYVVGGPEAHKTNQYEAMTNSLEEAERLVETIKGGQMKAVDVKPPYRGKGK